MNEQSDTPRTDASCEKIQLMTEGYGLETYAALLELSQCSRALERELKDAEEDSEVLHNYHNNPEWLKHRVKGRDYSFPEFVDNIIAERDQLRADLKMCAEALHQIVNEPSVIDVDKFDKQTIMMYSFQPNSVVHKDIVKCLSNLRIQQLLK